MDTIARLALAACLIPFPAGIRAGDCSDAPGLRTDLEFGAAGSAPGELRDPKGMAIDRIGRVWVSDTWNHRVQVFDAGGTLLFAFGGQGTGLGQLDVPRGCALAPDGTFYVADSRNDRVQAFDATGESLFAFGTSGDGPGELANPTGVAVLPDGRVWVTSQNNHRLELFEADGSYVRSVGDGEGGAWGQFSVPQAIASDLNGHVFVADAGNRRIQRLNADGVFLDEIRLDFGPGSVAVDAHGNVVAADSLGTTVAVFGGAGRAGPVDSGFDRPEALAVAPDGRIWVGDRADRVVVLTLEDVDLDGVADCADPCPFDAGDDADGDGLCANVDLCPFIADPDRADADADRSGDACDACPSDPGRGANGLRRVDRFQVTAGNVLRGMASLGPGRYATVDTRGNSAWRRKLGPRGEALDSQWMDNTYTTFADLYVAPDRTIWISEFTSIAWGLWRYDEDLRFLERWPGSELGFSPVAAAVGADGRVVVSDLGPPFRGIRVYDATRTELFRFDPRREGEAFTGDVEVDSAGNIYVGMIDRVEAFDATGEPRLTLATPGFLAISPSDWLFVSSVDLGTRAYDRGGKLLFVEPAPGGEITVDENGLVTTTIRETSYRAFFETFRLAVPDEDFDGAPDCNAACATSGLPGVVDDLRFTSSTALTWTEPQDLADPTAGFDVLTGRVGRWPVGSDLAETCTSVGVETTFSLMETPPPGTTRYVLVQSVNACAAGGVGSGTFAERFAYACTGRQVDRSAGAESRR